MGNFSKSPSVLLGANQKKAYAGIHVEREIPVLDRDLNLLQDLLAAALQSLIQKCIGDAVIDKGFSILTSTTANNFQITAGSVSVGGNDVTLAATINYTDQPGVPSLTTPTANRTDTVYLDVSISDVDGTTDPDLLNSGDVGVQTSVRQKLNRVVRVAENSSAVPAPVAGHTHFALARLNRTAGTATIQAGMIVDLRKQLNTLADLSAAVRAGLRPGFLSPPNEFSPTSGTPGALVTLNGRNFTVGKLVVRFVGPFPFFAAISSQSSTQAFVIIPADALAGTYQIVAENEFGTSITVNSFTLAKGFKEVKDDQDKSIIEKDVKELEESFVSTSTTTSEKLSAESLAAESFIGKSFIISSERPEVGGSLLRMSSEELA